MPVLRLRPARDAATKVHGVWEKKCNQCFVLMNPAEPDSGCRAKVLEQQCKFDLC
jgi:hypothetical protein